MRRILSILLENEPGSLSRIVGLFSQRAYNIDSLTVGTTDDHSLSRITITTMGDDRVVEQITKQVNKLVDVLKIIDLTEMAHIERELLLVKVFAQDEAKRAAVTRVVDVFQGAILDMGRNSYTLQLVSSTDKIESFLDTLRHETDIIEVVRSGAVGIGRGDKALKA
ncbi:acetolactate synthase small subunit [Pseudoalteromonas sp. SR44-5]|jgi:acetolactate synthase-1/3 small subunit|uniref:Acetolactate synthase small subunit n=1 Tax=Pseudoalteromonas rhizosphaerae TaxID=2518973 RepID=A0ABW8KTT5_9GAMM|nr:MULTISPECIES: acetolactate synthase small subunit [Pseudoalteromonas]MBB1293484.1 acetolactate synthase small subunit [Pseudoalteromonas sp. SR41-4]MBB1301667.1 acetolactate synthase small subunit [Pseudoalteromonas sp. SR44-8]MBB1309794.1 acetolactate synthase small subunit [Pseudoalteromonas sp. SR41-8]MBB1342253.1 acetolactate synthase small subunit [Pseudoalteromonas sp. SR45-6]MBB1367493.1 acetolactate synthase small subunit [Pseudoalteromonas sp. SR44-5]|tara:strand:+ start:2677 stop:3174 length:498 start_codon:yes stop_codon:yes gene_type:complete